MRSIDLGDVAWALAAATAICAMATCQVKREQNWRDIEVEKARAGVVEKE